MMSTEEKQIFDLMAIVEADQHERDHPDYKFKPKRQVTKIIYLFICSFIYLFIRRQACK